MDREFFLQVVILDHWIRVLLEVNPTDGHDVEVGVPRDTPGQIAKDIEEERERVLDEDADPDNLTVHEKSLRRGYKEMDLDEPHEYTGKKDRVKLKQKAGLALEHFHASSFGTDNLRAKVYKAMCPLSEKEKKEVFEVHAETHGETHISLFENTNSHLLEDQKTASLVPLKREAENEF